MNIIHLCLISHQLFCFMFRDHKKEEKVLGKFEEEHAHCNHIILPKLIIVSTAALAVVYFVQAGLLFLLGEHNIFAHFGQFWVFCRKFTHFWCSFSGIHIVVVYQIDKYEVCIHIYIDDMH